MAEENNLEHFLSKVEGYHKAIEEEFKILDTDNTEDVRKLIDKKIAAALPGFVDQLILIAQMGDTDNSRLKAIQFAFDWYFNKSGNKEDPFTKMLNELTRDEKKEDPTPATE